MSEKSLLGDLVAKTIVDLVKLKSTDELVIGCAEQTAENFKLALLDDDREFDTSKVDDVLAVKIAKEYLTEQLANTLIAHKKYISELPLLQKILRRRLLQETNDALSKFAHVVRSL
jgi:hypothetical protein